MRDSRPTKSHASLKSYLDTFKESQSVNQSVRGGLNSQQTSSDRNSSVSLNKIVLKANRSAKKSARANLNWTPY